MINRFTLALRSLPRTAAAALLAATLGACAGDVVDTTEDAEGAPNAGVPASGDGVTGGDLAGGGSGANGGTDAGGGTGGDASGGTGGGSGLVTGGAGFTLSLDAGATTLVEGEGDAEVRVSIARAPDYRAAVRLEAVDAGGDAHGFASSFADAVLEGAESETTLAVSLPIGPRPRLPGTRALRVLATDAGGARREAEIALPFTPTTRPDIYLLAGQSNMVGSSREGAREAAPGEPDEPVRRVRQLDVTANDRVRFPTPESFTDVSLIAPPDRRIVEALDPLHDTRDRGKDTKSGTTVGLGLSFAKAALADTTAEIVLVPTAWSDTGFCRRESHLFPALMGWNATPQESPALAGTLLFDRAIARADLAIAETGGVLRGILWHQGEADSAERDCALAYDENLREMVAAMRSRIAVDARGAAGRGPDAPIPFIAGTMSKGDDDRGPSLAPFGEIKSIVDGVHRNVASVVPHADVAIADDLQPPAYRCGQGFCIHFGAAALRELGTRYYERLREVLDRL